MRTISALAGALVLAGCASEPAELQLREARVEQITEDRFSVTVEAYDVDGYELARCVAAAYAFAQRDDAGELLYPFYVRDGGRIIDEFRRTETGRQQTTRGVQTYAFATAEDYTIDDHDGRDVMAVDLQLARCEKLGLPTTMGEG